MILKIIFKIHFQRVSNSDHPQRQSILLNGAWKEGMGLCQAEAQPAPAANANPTVRLQRHRSPGQAEEAAAITWCTRTRAHTEWREVILQHRIWYGGKKPYSTEKQLWIFN